MFAKVVHGGRKLHDLLGLLYLAQPSNNNHVLYIEAPIRVLSRSPCLFQLYRFDIADGARMLEHLCHVTRRIHILQRIK
jgi:hypothetical protein